MNSEKKLTNSETKKIKKVYGYILKVVNKNKGGEQASYNLPNEFFEYLKQNNKLKIVDMNKIGRNGISNTIYTLNENCNLKLDYTVTKYLDKNPTNPKLLITSGNGNKPQMRPKDYGLFKNIEQENYNWFIELYSKNLEQNTMVYEFSEINNELKISIKEEDYKDNICELKEEVLIENNILPKTQCIKYTLSTDSNDDKYKNLVDLKEYCTYEKFIGNFNEESKKYEPGPFIKLFVEAIKKLKKYNNDSQKNCTLTLKNIEGIINIEEIFGDFFNLLKRNSDGISEEHLILTEKKEGLKNYLEQELETKLNDIYFPNNFFINTIVDINKIDVNVNRSFEELKKYNQIEICIPYQRIFYGAPGTGKSYKLNKQSEIFDEIERVTFHPSYMYSNFIGCFKPYTVKKEDKNEISYEFVAGPLVDILVKSLKNKNKNYLLIIEEINRADVASVFGDFFQLLDRDEYGKSRYIIRPSKELRDYLNEKLGENVENIYLPNNLYIWATMNSSDQGVKPLDTAFKRRWDFEYVSVNENEEEIENYTFKINNEEYFWNDIRKKINSNLLEFNIPEDKLLGTFFIGKETLEKGSNEIRRTIKNKVLMYLYDDAAKMYRTKIFKKSNNEIGTPAFSEILTNFEYGLDKVFNFIGQKDEDKNS